MTEQDKERLKQVIAAKKAKGGYMAEKMIGSGKVERRNKNINTDSERTKKISQ